MNLLRLSGYLYSKRLLHEFILLIQLVLMTVFAFSVLNPIDTFQMQVAMLREVYQMDFENTIHFAAGNAIIQSEWKGDYSNQNVVYERIVSIPQVHSVIRSYGGGASYYTDVDQNIPVRKSANFIVFSEEMTEKIELQLSEGDIVAGSDSYLRIVVSASLAKELPLGTEKEIIMEQNGKAITCIVSGVLDENGCIPIVSTYGSSPTLDVFAAFPGILQGADFIIACYDENCIGDIIWGSNYLITIEQGANVSDIQTELESAVGMHGTLETVSSVIQQAFHDMLQSNRWNIFATALLALIALFGYGGYLFLMLRQRQREFAVFYLLGMTRKRMASVLFITGGIILTLSMWIGSCIVPWYMQSVLHMKQSHPGPTSYLFCAGILLAILLGSVIVGFKHSFNEAAVTLYHGGD